LTTTVRQPVAFPNTGGDAQGSSETANFVLALAAAALAVGTVIFVGSARKGAPDGNDGETKREGDD
jgi:hypothetical protein